MHLSARKWQRGAPDENRPDSLSDKGRYCSMLDASDRFKLREHSHQMPPTDTSLALSARSL